MMLLLIVEVNSGSSARLGYRWIYTLSLDPSQLCVPSISATACSSGQVV